MSDMHPAFTRQGKSYRSSGCPRSKWRLFEDHPPRRRVLQHHHIPELWCIEEVDGRGRLITTYDARIEPPISSGFFARLGDAQVATAALTHHHISKRESRP
jgi:hypothetical protein